MLLGEIRDATIKLSIQAKEKACAKRPTDIHPVIDVYRGGEPVATIQLWDDCDGQTVVRAYQMAVTGFDADQSSWMAESYTDGPSLPAPNIHPVTGRKIEAGDLSALAANGGIERGWVRECLCIQVANKAGDILAARLPYHYAVNGRCLVWDEQWLSPHDADVHAVGAMANRMNEAMTVAPSFSQVFPGVATEEVSRAELDLAVVNVIYQVVPCNAILWARHGGSREHAIQEQIWRA